MVQEYGIYLISVRRNEAFWCLIETQLELHIGILDSSFKIQLWWSPYSLGRFTETCKMSWHTEVKPKPHYMLSPFKKIRSMPLHTRHKLITLNSDHNCKSKPKKIFLTPEAEYDIWAFFYDYDYLCLSSMSAEEEQRLKRVIWVLSLSSTSTPPSLPSLKSQRTLMPCNAFQCWYADPYSKSQLNPVVAPIVYCFLRRSSTATVTELVVCVCLCSKPE